MSIKDFRVLEVYQRCQKLLAPVKKLSKKIEKDHRDLARNLIKTACQIGPQIAEGYAKKSSANEFKRYLDMGIGSTDEMIAHLEQVIILADNVNKESIKRLISEYEIIAKQLQTLKKVWK